MKPIQIFAIIAGMLLIGRYVQAADLVIAQGGNCDYQIVVPETVPAPSVGEGLQQAARLLQVAFKANGAVVPVVAESKRDPARPAIWLGDTAFAREQKIDLGRLKGWGYVLKVVGSDVVIAGRDHAAPAKATQPRRPTWDRFGTAKGVVDFIQQYVGTRFLYPDLGPYQPIGSAATIDMLNSPAFEFLKTDPVVVPSDLNVSKTPLIEFNTAHPARGSFYDLAHNRFPLVDTIFGGHTYERAVPRETYATSHPEYFALIGGKRTASEPGNAQYCISNLEVQELFYKDLIDSIDRGYECVDLGQPDGFRACQCEACDKLFGTGKDWGEKLWILHRNLAERVEKARPGKLVTMMSYIQTELPPKSFKAFPSNTRILLTGTNEEDIAPWRGHEVPGGFSSYIYNWCPNLGTRYTPMRTPLFVEAQVKRLAANKIQSVYRDGPGDLYGLEGPTYYTMGRMFDDPANLSAKGLVQEFCGAAFGLSAPAMTSFYNQLYHGIELYSNYLGTRDPAWVYHDIYGRRRKHLTDPLQFLGFLYSPSLLQALERDLAAAEKLADSEKVKQRLALVRREFDYLQALIKVVHLYHAYETQPDLASRERVLNAVDSRNTYIDSLFAAPRNGPTPLDGFSFVPFPQLGHDAKHLRLNYDGYQEPFANSVMNWDTKAMRSAPLPGAKRLTVKTVAGSVTADAPVWQQAAEAGIATRLPSGNETNATDGTNATVGMLSSETHLFVRVEAAAPTSDSRDSIDVLLAPIGGKDIVYRFTVGPQADSKQDAANGFNSDPLDPRFGKFDPDWNGEWQYESRLDAKSQRWTALLAIPFKTLGTEHPTAGSFWRGNISHTRSTPDRTDRSLWSASSSTKTLDDRNDFGELVFEAPATAVAKPLKHPLTAEVPQTVEELWLDFDPQKDALETEVIREFTEDGGVFRHVRFVVGTFKGQTARMTAIYGFPAAAKEKLPAVMHIHGGGQRAFLSEVKLLVSRGYAGLSVNWGGSAGQRPFNSVEGAQPGEPNTDWGAVDPSQLNATRYDSILPGPLQVFEDREHPKNNNWYLLTVGCRRGLTFLEQQPEVNPQRLGVHGYSMGGNLTMYVAGTDRRVKVAVPGVGGAGWRWLPHEFLGGIAQQDRIQGDVEIFRRTLSFESYAPLIRCPVLHRSATNDFHGWMDDVYRTNSLIPSQPLRYSWTPHVNHRLSPEVAIAMPLWFDQHLQGGPPLPETPATQLELQTADHVPLLRVVPDSKTMPAARVEIFYSVDPDPRARFWRSADIARDGDAFTGKLPLHTLDLPLFAFANVYHTLPKPESLAPLPGHSQPVNEVCLSSDFHSLKPEALKAAGVEASQMLSPLIDDFSLGLRDWYSLNANHPTLVQHWTRKLTDPAWRGRDGAKLKLTLKVPKTNTLSFVVIENEWRNYRGPKKTFVCEREITGSDIEQSIVLVPQDFLSNDGLLRSWDGIDQFGICAHFAERGGTPSRKPSWNGPPPTFVRLKWE